jgi:hypothetical protein
MDEQRRAALFEKKVAELLTVTSGLGVTHVVLLRRMTVEDPETSVWATSRELEVVFEVILDRALAAIEVEALGAAADRQFDDLLPPGSDEQRDKERWWLFDVSKKYLARRRKVADAPVVVPPAAPVEEDEEEPVAFSSFPQLFDETLARYCRNTLRLLAIGPQHASVRPHIPLPFLLAPGFDVSYESLLRRYVLPDIRATKRIAHLATSRNWSDNGANRLIAIVQSQANPILETWDSRWQAYRSEGVGAKRAKNEDPWAVFHAAAQAGAYAPPTVADIPLLHSVIRWEPESLREAWRDVALLYQQEFHPVDRKEQAREGALRDGMIRIVRSLPKRAGDMVVIKAFFELPKCDRMFLRKMLQSLGGTESERRRIAPALVQFYTNLPP